MMSTATATYVEGPFFEVAYAHDGTLEGLLSAVFEAYARHEDPTDIVSAEHVQLRLGQMQRTIRTDVAHALRVQRQLCLRHGNDTFNAIKVASLSDEPHTGTTIYRFIRYAMDTGTSRACTWCAKRNVCTYRTGTCKKPFGKSHRALADVTHPLVAPLLELQRSVANERHLMMQFIRFEHMSNGVWFARCNPKASVVPLLMDYFSARFNTQAFIVYDENHHIAGVYDGRDWYLVKVDTALSTLEYADEERLAQDAWRTFYNTIAIESRYNPDLRRQFMPMRFWKNLTEMQPAPFATKKGDLARPAPENQAELLHRAEALPVSSPVKRQSNRMRE